jgi:hypothetical protein
LRLEVRRHNGVIQASHFQLEGNASQGNEPARVHQVALACDLYAVDLGAVGGAQILDQPMTGFPRKPSVMT